MGTGTSCHPLCPKPSSIHCSAHDFTHTIPMRRTPSSLCIWGHWDSVKLGDLSKAIQPEASRAVVSAQMCPTWKPGPLQATPAEVLVEDLLSSKTSKIRPNISWWCKWWSIFGGTQVLFYIETKCTFYSTLRLFAKPPFYLCFTRCSAHGSTVLASWSFHDWLVLRPFKDSLIMNEKKKKSMKKAQGKRLLTLALLMISWIWCQTHNQQKQNEHVGLDKSKSACIAQKMKQSTRWKGSLWNGIKYFQTMHLIKS